MEQSAVKRAKVTMEKKISDDLISSLPDHMLHQIMNRLPSRYAAATSVLSHRWEKIWLSFPCIDLDESFFKNKEQFCSCLRSTLAHHILSDLQNLRLHMFLPSTPPLFENVCEFLNIVLRESKILKDLDIEFSDFPFPQIQQESVLLESLCVLPKETFSLSSHLVFLRIEGCRVEGCPVFNLPSLKNLIMKFVFITEEFLMTLVHGCPVVDTLSIKYCFGIKNIQICHPALKNLVIGFRTDLESLDLNVPRVKCIKLHALVDSMTEEGLVNILGYTNSTKFLAQNLEKLFLKCLLIESEVLHNIISIFPNLEKLEMHYCDILGRVQLYSNRLTSLAMNDCLLVEEVEMRTPKLQHFKYLHNPDGVQLKYSKFMYLRSLFMDSIEVDHGILCINNSNFPALVHLKLASCMNLKKLRIAANELETLDVSECEDLEFCMIIALKLSSFSYTGKVVHMAPVVASKKLAVTLNLKQMEIDYEHVEMGFVEKLMKFLQRVGRAAASMIIEMGYGCAKCLVMIKDVRVPPISFLQHLKVVTWTNLFDLQEFISCALGISTYCNILSISYLSWFSLTLEFQEIKEINKPCSRMTDLARIKDHLVRGEIKGFNGSIEEVVLLEFLVGNARNMKHLKIWIAEGEEYATQNCFEACQRMLRVSFPSEDVNIVSHGGYVSFTRNAI